MDDWVTIGRIVKPHGIRGEVVVRLLSDVPDRLGVGVEVQVVPGPSAPTTVVGCRPHQGRLLVRFADVTDRSAAELLRGCELRAAPIELDDHDTFFAHELVGLAVEGPDGADLGAVAALIELPEAAGYDLLEVVRADGSTWLLPAVEAYVEVIVDADDRLRLRVTDPPDGLLELTEAGPPAAGGSATPPDR